MRIDAVVADANVLLSAVIGKAALRVFTDFEVAVHVAEFNLAEVEEYVPRLADKYALPQYLLRLNLRLLPISVHPEEDYKTGLAAARERLAERDPDDAHPLALAIALSLPLWSNDRDFEGCGVEVHPTSRLLALLDRRDPR
jgi:predicted nucleic acid-binding protein